MQSLRGAADFARIEFFQEKVRKWKSFGSLYLPGFERLNDFLGEGPVKNEVKTKLKEWVCTRKLTGKLKLFPFA